MNAHQLDANGVILNTIVVDSLNVFPNLIDASVGGTAGDTWNGTAIVKKPRDLVADALAALELSKTTGIDILGVMCSATKADQSGLTAVALGVTLARMANTTFPATKFEFENGNSLIVTNANFDTIYAAWTPFRQSFFRP